MSNRSARDWLTILDVWSNVLGTIGTLGVAIVGIWFTQSFNNSQQKIDRNEALTSIIGFIEEEAQLRTVYNILVDLGYEEDFFEQSVDRPNSIATLKLIDLLTDEELKIQEGARRALDEIITRLEDFQNQKILITGEEAADRVIESEELLITSVELIAVQTKEAEPSLSSRADATLEWLQEKDSQSQMLRLEAASEQDLWVIVFGNYSSPITSNSDIKALQDINTNSDGQLIMYERDGRYRLVLQYENPEQATDALKDAKALRASAYLRNLGRWCEPQGRCVEVERRY